MVGGFSGPGNNIQPGDATNRDRDFRTTQNTNATEDLSGQLNTAAANPVDRTTPQATAAPGVYSDVTTATKPTATNAVAPTAIAAPTVTAATIAPMQQVTTNAVTADRLGPAAQVTAAPIAATPGAIAGQVTAAQVDTSQQAQFRAQQQRLTDALEAAASGNAPSAAQIQAKQSSDEAMANQLALVGMNHGRGANSALRTAGRNVAAIQQKAALDNALIRATESATARGQEATVLGQGREQDIGVASKQADLTQGAGTTNATLGTQVSISNADRTAAANMKDSELKLAAGQGNQAAADEMAKRQAELDLAASTTTAGNALSAAQGNQTASNTAAIHQADLTQGASAATAGNQLEAAKSNQTADLTTNLANAAASNTASIVGATEENKVSLANAQQDLQSQLANQNNATSVALANAGFTLQGRTIDDARNIAAVNQALAAQSQLSTDLDKQKAMDLARAQFNQAVADKDWNRAMQITTAVLSATGTVAASAVASDRRAKKGIKRESDKDVNDFLGALEAWNYEYKDKAADGDGRKSGPMAQELEKSLIGRTAVKVGPDGKKMVDTGRLTMALAGAVARLAKQKRRAA